MKKKIMVGLLTAVTCFTLGSTSFAASATIPTSSNSQTAITKVAATDTKYVTSQAILPKSSFPTFADIPQTMFYNVDAYQGTLTLRTIDYETAWGWTVTYHGYVTHN